MREPNEEQSVRFDLEVGTPYQGELEMGAPIGCGVRHEGSDYTAIRFWSLPRFTFYLRQNQSRGGSHEQGGEIGYTLYARKCMRNGGISFENPVGQGLITDALPGYIEILLRFPRDRVFLSLYPSGKGDDT